MCVRACVRACVYICVFCSFKNFYLCCSSLLVVYLRRTPQLTDRKLKREVQVRRIHMHCGLLVSLKRVTETVCLCLPEMYGVPTTGSNMCTYTGKVEISTPPSLPPPPIYW